jgi:FixJ family two-component response regulator
METPAPTVVVVEDDSATLKALGRVLKALGFDAALYSSTQEFLASLPQTTPICLLLDAHVKGTPGLDLQHQVAALGSSLPIIVMSALDDLDVRADAVRMGCVGYFDKTSNVDELRKLISSVHHPATDRKQGD